MLEQSENTNKAIQNELKLCQAENNDLKVKVNIAVDLASKVLRLLNGYVPLFYCIL